MVHQWLTFDKSAFHVILETISDDFKGGIQMSIHVKSEIGKLKTVVVHRPGQELEHLTPNELKDLLFDDIPWLERAQFEHDQFCQILKNEGVQVFYLVDLVAESLTNLKVKQNFIETFLNEAKVFHPSTRRKLMEYLSALDIKTMISKTMAGIQKNELTTYKKRSLRDHIREYPFLTAPMPNLYFTRDPFASIQNHVMISRMHRSVRNRETIYGRTIFKYHPIYQTHQIYDASDINFSIEGGDILVLNEHVIAIGISERTQPEAIEHLTLKLFENSEVQTILAINLPKKRSFMHLDTVLTQVDAGVFLAHHHILGKLQAYELTRSSQPGMVKILEKEGTLKKIFSNYLHQKITVIPCGGSNQIASDREQWNDGANALAIAPGVVIVYERNQVTNAKLREQGIRTIAIPSSELSRGRGGPRCMSMPLERE